MRTYWHLLFASMLTIAGMIYGAIGSLMTNEVAVRADLTLANHWPFTADRGVIACDRNGTVIFRTPNGDSYAMNRTGSGTYLPVDWIRKLDDLPHETFTTAVLVDESRRRSIFADITFCEHERRSARDCTRDVAAQTHITPRESGQIRDEGVSMNWPPLPPRHIDIGPFIERGLRLCR